MTDFLLNCFVLGDDEERVFSVEIARDKNVGILKQRAQDGKQVDRTYPVDGQRHSQQ